MKAFASRDALTGAGVIATAALLLFVVFPLGIVLPTNAESSALAPDFWPTIIVAIAAIAGLCLIIRSLRRRSQDPVEEQHALQNSFGGAMRVAAAFGAMLACYALIPGIGLVACAILLCAGLMWLGGERRIMLIATVSILLPILLYFFFSSFAGVPIPTGVFEGMLDPAGS